MLLTFGIVFLHSITFGVEDKIVWLWRFLHICVDGFVFISGWYGITFRPSKIIRLYGLSTYCSLIVLLIGLYTGFYSFSSNCDFVEIIIKTKGLCFNNWFLKAYILLMLLAPLIEAILKWAPREIIVATLFPALLLTFGWSFMCELPHIDAFCPRASGIGSYTGLTLFSVYILARLWRYYHWDVYFTKKRLCLALIILSLLVMLGFNYYASPMSALLAGCTFLLIRRIHFPKWIACVALFIAPSAFTIFLLHCNSFGFSCFSSWEAYLIEQWGCSQFLGYVMVSIIVFTGAFMMDIPRRILIYFMKPFYTSFLNLIDEGYARVINIISHRNVAH